jgi:hypothetical protein
MRAAGGSDSQALAANAALAELAYERYLACKDAPADAALLPQGHLSLASGATAF